MGTAERSGLVVTCLCVCVCVCVQMKIPMTLGQKKAKTIEQLLEELGLS